MGTREQAALSAHAIEWQRSVFRAVVGAYDRHGPRFFDPLTIDNINREDVLCATLLRAQNIFRNKKPEGILDINEKGEIVTDADKALSLTDRFCLVFAWRMACTAKPMDRRLAESLLTAQDLSNHVRYLALTKHPRELHAFAALMALDGVREIGKLSGLEDLVEWQDTKVLESQLKFAPASYP